MVRDPASMKSYAGTATQRQNLAAKIPQNRLQHSIVVDLHRFKKAVKHEAETDLKFE